MHRSSVTSSAWFKLLKHVYQHPQAATRRTFVPVLACLLLYGWSALLLLTIGVWGIKLIQPGALGDVWNTVFAVSVLGSFLLVPAAHILRTEQRSWLLGISALTAAMTLWLYHPCPSCTQRLALVTPATLPTLSNDDLRVYHQLLQEAQQYQTFCTFFTVVGLVFVGMSLYQTWHIVRPSAIHPA